MLDFIVQLSRKTVGCNGIYWNFKVTKMTSNVRRSPPAHYQEPLHSPGLFGLSRFAFHLLSLSTVKHCFPAKKESTFSSSLSYITIPSLPPHCLLAKRSRNRDSLRDRDRDERHIKGYNGGNTGNGGEPCHGVRPNPCPSSRALLLSLTPKASA